MFWVPLRNFQIALIQSLSFYESEWHQNLKSYFQAISNRQFNSPFNE